MFFCQNLKVPCNITKIKKASHSYNQNIIFIMYNIVRYHLIGFSFISLNFKYFVGSFYTKRQILAFCIWHLLKYNAFKKVRLNINIYAMRPKLYFY